MSCAYIYAAATKLHKTGYSTKATAIVEPTQR